MEKTNNGIELTSFYRGQCLYEDKIVRTMPARRISLTKDKGIIFNPDQSRYVFFSPSYTHHVYYLIKKMLDTMNAFLRKMGKDTLTITTRDFDNYQKIKQACNALGALKREVKIESMEIDFLSQVKKFIDDCSIDSKLKNEGQLIPEITDKRVCGGGLGLAEDWLELVKYTTVFSKTKNFNLEDFLNFALEKKNKKLTRKKMCEVYELKNPIFHLVRHISEKDSSNKIYKAIENIYEREEYDTSNQILTDSYFAKQRKLIKKAKNEALLEMQ